MTKKEANKIAVQLFKSHPTVDNFHITEDGQAFFTETSAGNHSQSLGKESEVILVKREDVLDAELDNDDSGSTVVKTKPYSVWKKDDLLLELAKRTIEAPEGATNKALAELLQADDDKK